MPKQIFPKKEKLFESVNLTHYYGNIVRICFLASALLMLFFMPFLTDYLPITIYWSLFIILGLGLFSGLTNPKLVWVAILDLLISLFGTFTFGYWAVDSYLKYSILNLYFWTNEILGLIFLVSLYFSTKTVRGFFLPDERK